MGSEAAEVGGGAGGQRRCEGGRPGPVRRLSAVAELSRVLQR